jgi:hypothetical protein
MSTTSKIINYILAMNNWFVKSSTKVINILQIYLMKFCKFWHWIQKVKLYLKCENQKWDLIRNKSKKSWLPNNVTRISGRHIQILKTFAHFHVFGAVIILSTNVCRRRQTFVDVDSFSPIWNQLFENQLLLASI